MLLSLKKNLKGIYNLSSGRKIYLKKISLFLSKITSLKVSFLDLKTESFMLDNKKLIKKLKYKQEIKELNFNSLKKYI